jgi:Domain of unknown function (DUF4291)
MRAGMVEEASGQRGPSFLFTSGRRQQLTWVMFEIRAQFSETAIRVYQAYSPQIAYPALAAGRFVPPFKLLRMTWIKPSFNWMMYRSGFGRKPGEECVLGIDITREGFDWALDHAVLSTYLPAVHGGLEHWQKLLAKMPVRIQWDPERDWTLREIKGVRAIQIGLSAEAVPRYVNDWIVQIQDVTTLAHSIAADAADSKQPPFRPDELERPYPMRPALAKRLVPILQRDGGSICIGCIQATELVDSILTNDRIIRLR